MLAGKVPDLIRFRTGKQPFSPDFAERFNCQVPAVEQALAAIPRGDPLREIVDVPKLQRMSCHRMTGSHGAGPAEFDAMHNLPAGVYLIEFSAPVSRLNRVACVTASQERFFDIPPPSVPNPAFA